LYSWWEHHGSGRALRLVTLREREGGTLVGLLPLMIERRPGFGRLLFLGGSSVSYKDVLAREGWEDEVAQAGTRILPGVGPCDVADLQELRPQALARELFRRWPGYKTQAWIVNYLTVEVRPWDDLLASVSKNMRKMARRTLRRMEADGVQRRSADPEDAGRAARRLVELHREMWRGRWIDPTHLSRGFEAHMTDVVRRITASDYGGVSEHWRDGEVVISLFWVSHGEFFGTYMVGASREALERYSISSAYVWDALGIAHSRGGAYVSFMAGEDPYKLRWNPSRVPIQRVILGRSLIPWAVYAGYYILRSRFRRYRQDVLDAPTWAGSVARNVRVWRSRILSLPYTSSKNPDNRDEKQSKRD
jgi:CelD/BcsL family acetyltransferase involved in cellulose biosynthesis